MPVHKLVQYRGGALLTSWSLSIAYLRYRKGILHLKAVAVSPKTLTVNEGGSASFHCSVSGTPNPIIVWSKTNRQSSRSMVSGGKLLLKNVRGSDSGTYNCSAVNKLGQAQALVQLIVIHRRKMSAHALLKMTRDLFRAMSLAPRQKCPRNVVEMKGAMAAFFGSDSVAISCHCKRSKIILVKVLT